MLRLKQEIADNPQPTWLMKTYRAPEIQINRKILAFICASVLVAILTAGLWPFTPYLDNNVSWSTGSNGLQFGAHGAVLSAGTFQTSNARDEPSCSIEIWLRPALTNANRTILDFYNAENPATFRLRQYGDDFLVQRGVPDQQKKIKIYEIDMNHLFRRQGQFFVTITSGAQGNTSVYLNGALLMMTSHWGLTNNNFTGQLVIGNSPVRNDSWSGQLQGLAIYNQQLTATQILQHYNAWTKAGRSETSEEQDPIALYLFQEQAGRTVHNQVASGPALYIPDHFFILHQPLLESPWTNFRPDWNYFKDDLINIAGFAPLGFFFCAFLSSAFHRRHALVETIILGAAVSLFIEILQSHMPTRDSDMTDVITNTLGTITGALLYNAKPTQALLTNVGIRIERRT